MCCDRGLGCGDSGGRTETFAIRGISEGLQFFSYKPSALRNAPQYAFNIKCQGHYCTELLISIPITAPGHNHMRFTVLCNENVQMRMTIPKYVTLKVVKKSKYGVFILKNFMLQKEKKITGS